MREWSFSGGVCGRIDVAVGEGWKRRQAEQGAHALAVGRRHAVLFPGIELAAWAGAQRMDAAMHVGGADFPAQGNAASPAVFRSLHRGAQGCYLDGQLRWYHPCAAVVGDLAAVERHPEVGAACATAQAWVFRGGVIRGRAARFRKGPGRVRTSAEAAHGEAFFDRRQRVAEYSIGAVS